MPTILELLDIPAETRMQGASLRGFWSGSDPSPRLALSEALSTAEEAKSLRSDRYKYVVTLDAKIVERHGRAFIPEHPATVELFDLETDPGEQQSLLGSPDAETIQLASRLDAELRRLVEQRAGRAERIWLDPETLEQIKALGYVE